MEGMTQDHIENSIVQAFNYKSNLTEDYFEQDNQGAEVLKLLGFTSPKVKHLLNNLCNFDGCSYLELGVWAGATFCSAIYNNDIHAVAVDRFGEAASNIYPVTINSQTWQNLVGDVPIKDQCVSNIKKYKKDNSKIQIFQSDIFEFDLNFIKEPINVFMLDCDQGADDAIHDTHFHSHIIDYCKDVFADEFIFIKDDWNWTRHSTRLGLEKLTDYKIIHDIELFTQNIEDYNDFWNGIYIALLEKK